MWLDRNGDGLLDDSEKIIANLRGAVGTSASQSLTGGANVRFRIRYEEEGTGAYLRLTVKSA